MFNSNSLKNMEDEDISYKLEVEMSPNWFNISKHFFIEESVDNDKIIDNLIKSLPLDGSDLWGSSYTFTEYFDSRSGLLIKTMKAHLKNGKTITSYVDEFQIVGNIFNSYTEYESKFKQPFVLVTEEGIYKEPIDDISGAINVFHNKEDALFTIPLGNIFYFLINLGLNINNLEKHIVIKWPKEIQDKLEKSGLSYNHYTFDDVKFDLESKNKALFLKYKNLQISNVEQSMFNDSCSFSSKEISHYSLKLRLFHPKENERIY